MGKSVPHATVGGSEVELGEPVSTARYIDFASPDRVNSYICERVMQSFGRVKFWDGAQNRKPPGSVTAEDVAAAVYREMDEIERQNPGQVTFNRDFVVKFEDGHLTLEPPSPSQ